MSKKNYNGLEVESILFGENDITTAELYYDSPGCRVSTISIYNEDNDHNPMPLGTCYYDDPGDVSLTWASPNGGIA